jgi:hypothetical protein
MRKREKGSEKEILGRERESFNAAQKRERGLIGVRDQTRQGVCDFWYGKGTNNMVWCSGLNVYVTNYIA